jgi:hypothetical protein
MFNSIKEARVELIRSVAGFCAAAALTESAAKGDLAWENNAPDVETKFLDDPQVLLRLAPITSSIPDNPYLYLAHREPYRTHHIEVPRGRHWGC